MKEIAYASVLEDATYVNLTTNIKGRQIEGPTKDIRALLEIGDSDLWGRAVERASRSSG